MKRTDIIEGFRVSHRVCENDSMCTFVISLCDIFVPLLSCSIPDLKFQSVIIYGNSFNFEVDSNRSDIILLELIATKPD
mgnify:CR=1 FL=1